MEPSCVDSVFSVISFMAFVTNSLAAPQFGVPGYSAAANMSSLFDLFDPNKVDSEPEKKAVAVAKPASVAVNKPLPGPFKCIVTYIKDLDEFYLVKYETDTYNDIILGIQARIILIVIKNERIYLSPAGPPPPAPIVLKIFLT